MSDTESLCFQMGLYRAAIPAGLLYSQTHFWLQQSGANGTRCGLTAYATRLLGDIYRIEWRVRPGQPIASGQLLGETESTKAVSELFAPLIGSVAAVNEQVLSEPSLVSLRPYEAWLIEFDGQPQNVLTADAYVAFLAQVWPETMKLLRGKA
jgi:glycine cleavage system H protein